MRHSDRQPKNSKAADCRVLESALVTDLETRTQSEVARGSAAHRTELPGLSDRPIVSASLGDMQARSESSDPSGVEDAASLMVETALELLDTAAGLLAERHPNPMRTLKGTATSRDQRARLQIHASSIDDFTFWVERLDDGRYKATEVESGVSGEVCGSAEAAIESYWQLDRGTRPPDTP